MSEHVFTTTVLEPSIRLDENSLSSTAWKYFNEMLANDPCSLRGILSKNGLQVDSANGMLQDYLGND
jgi:hypothetical protein